MINIIIADDKKLVRDGLKMLLSLYEEINVINEAENGMELITTLNKVTPDIVLMDVRMPLMNGIEATKIIKNSHKNVKVIILTSFIDDDFIFDSLKNGADGYLLKDAGSEYLYNAIKSVYNGEMFLDPKVTSKVVNAFNFITQKNNKKVNQITINLNLLTPREKEVAKLVAEGKNNKEICKALFLTEGTVKNYVTKILDKLNLKSRTELAVLVNKTL
ncbi:MAG: response regulator transcription factor [Clostridium sp.]|nr:response regulator transcription factor [Clostridium sp.]